MNTLNIGVLFLFTCFPTVLPHKDRLAELRPPKIYVQPEQVVYFAEGRSVVLPCLAAGSPEPEYSWKLNSRPLNLDEHTDRITMLPGNGTLTFTNPDESDEGYYQCFATNSLGVSLSTKTFLRAAKLGAFYGSEDDVTIKTVYAGDSLVLPCFPPVSVPNFDVFWSVTDESGSVIPIMLDKRVSGTPEGLLLFANVQKNDEMGGKRYSCNVMNYFLRRVVSGSFHIIQVREGPQLASPPQLAYSSPSYSLAIAGSDFKLSCMFAGNPTPDVSWEYDISDDVKNSTLQHISIKNFGMRLQISNVQLEHEGIYTCSGLNTQASSVIKVPIHVRVEEAPHWTSTPQDQVKREGESAMFKCDADGRPEPDIIWSINGLPVDDGPNDRQVVRITKHDLGIFDLKLSDTLNVQCNATNKHGYVFAEASLIVGPAADWTKKQLDLTETVTAN